MKKFKPYHKVSPRLVASIYLSVILMSVVYYLIGKFLFNSPLQYREYLIFTSVLAAVIIGGYQLYFWTEYNNHTAFKAKCYKTWLDDKIPHWPIFVWIYSFSYYAVIGLVIVTIPTLEKGLEYIFGGLVLLTAQCLIFYFFPSIAPSEWRKYRKNSKSARFLDFVQTLDCGRNCMPSMHMSVATYVSLLLMPILSYYSFIFVFIIAISCLFVKQHPLMDLLPGVALGWLVYVIVL